MIDDPVTSPTPSLRSAIGRGWRWPRRGRDYVAQPFNQDTWMARESALGGREALDALLALCTLNAALYASLMPADRAIEFSHPEYGLLTVDWLIHQSAGHLVHHVKQIEALAGT